MQTHGEGTDRRIPVTEARGLSRDGGSSGRRVGLAAVVLLLFGTLGISTAYGMLLLLPLYVQELGGNEANFCLVLSTPRSRRFFA